jgi:hypothetical protein
MGRLLRVETLAMELPHFAVGFMPTAAGTILAEFQALSIVPPVFFRRVIALPAVGTLQGDNSPNVSSFSRHLSIPTS